VFRHVFKRLRRDAVPRRGGEGYIGLHFDSERRVFLDDMMHITFTVL